MLIVLMLAIGTVGYVFIEGYSWIDAVYMTIITLSTVGFGEVQKLDTAGKIFTSALIVTNIGIFTYTVSAISTMLLSGDIRKQYKLSKMNEKIKALRGHVILCGFGRNGQAAASVLRDSGQPYVIIENNDDIIDGLPADELYVKGDATDEEALQDAGIMNAGSLIAVLPEDADNIYITLAAHEMRPDDLIIVARASHQNAARKLKHAGARWVMQPDNVTGSFLANYITRPGAMDFMEIISSDVNKHEKGRVEELICPADITVGGMDIRSRSGAILIGLRRSNGDYIVSPDDDEKITRGETLILLGTHEQLKKAAEYFSTSIRD
jgi:voltage-gated potassium channel